MSPYQTIAVAVRLFAVWLLISMATGLITFATQFRWQDYPNKGLTIGLVVVATGIVVLVLWFFPNMIARRLLTASAAKPSDASPSIPADTWLAMGCAVVGLWVMASALPAIIRECVILSSSDQITDTSEVRHGLLYDSARVAIAVWLMFGAVGFRGLFWWARNAGISKPAD
jgi:hypothetical protein